MLALLSTALAATPAEIVRAEQFQGVAVMPWLRSARTVSEALARAGVRIDARADGHRAAGVAVCDVPQSAMGWPPGGPHYTGGDDVIEAKIEKKPHRGSGRNDRRPKALQRPIPGWSSPGTRTAARTGGVVGAGPWAAPVRGTRAGPFPGGARRGPRTDALTFERRSKRRSTRERSCPRLSDAESVYAYHVTTDIGAGPSGCIAAARRTMTAHTSTCGSVHGRRFRGTTAGPTRPSSASLAGPSPVLDAAATPARDGPDVSRPAP